MNTTTLQSSTPTTGTDARETYQFSLPRNRRELLVRDRLALRLGLWLMLRSERPRTTKRPAYRTPASLEPQFLTPAEQSALLGYDLLRQLR